MAIGNFFLTLPTLISLEGLIALGLVDRNQYAEILAGRLFGINIAYEGRTLNVVFRGEGMAVTSAGLTGLVNQVEVYDITDEPGDDPTAAPLVAFLILPVPTPAGAMIQAVFEQAGTNRREAPDIAGENEVNFVSHEALFDLILDPQGSFGMVYTGSEGDDLVNGYKTNDNLNAAGGDDMILLSPGTDLIQGGAGQDTVDGRLADAPITLGADGVARYGMNTATLTEIEGFIGSDQGDALTASAAISTLFGALGNDTLTGSAGNDDLNGNEGDDSILGGAGDDTISDGGGADTMDGGEGSDTYLSDFGEDRINDSGTAGIDSLFVNTNGQAADAYTVEFDMVTGRHGSIEIDVGRDIYLGIEVYDFTGLQDVTVAGTGVANRITTDAGDDTLQGRGGNDTLDGGAGDDLAVMGVARAGVTARALADGIELTSSEGVDTLIGIERVQFSDQTVAVTALIPTEPGIFDNGTPAPDTINGGSGNDTLNGRGSSDSIDGIAGDDILNGGFGFDTLVGGSGNDTLIGSNGFDSQLGGAGNDSLVGNFGNDTLSGGAGNDTLEGGLGFDRMVGDEGDDFLQARDGFDTLIGGAGNDTLEGNNGNDALDGGAGDDRLEGGLGADDMLGGADNDTLLGANGFDVLDGGAGDDLVQGNSGNDTVDGGAGNDTLQGGLGADTFIYSAGADRIADLQPIDSIEIEADLLTEANPVADDLRGYASLDAAGNLVLDFGGGNTLTFVGVGNTGAILDDVSFV